MKKSLIDTEMLRHALAGYALELERINLRIAEIRAQLDTNGSKTAEKGLKIGRMSKEGRAAIAAAQKRRWAKLKAEQTKQSGKSFTKTLSPRTVRKPYKPRKKPDSESAA